MFKNIPSWVKLLFVSGVLVPAVAFLVGQWLVGPYEGRFGVLGFFVSIYVDALQAKPAAWILLTALPLMLMIGKLGWRISRNAGTVSGSADSAQKSSN